MGHKQGARGYSEAALSQEAARSHQVLLMKTKARTGQGADHSQLPTCPSMHPPNLAAHCLV